MTIDWGQIIKDAVIGRLVAELLEEGDGTEILIEKSAGGMVDIYIIEDADYGPPAGYNRWVKLVPGNGPARIISDYTENLAAALKPVLEFADAFDVGE